MPYIPNSEYEFLTNKKNVKKAQWGVLKQRLITKVRALKDSKVSRALCILSINERKEIIKKFLNVLPSNEIDDLFEEHKKYLNRLDIQNYFIKNHGINLNLKEILSIKNFNPKNKRNLELQLKKIINSDYFVISRKIVRDKIYIQFTTRNIFKNKKVHPSKIRLFKKIRDREKPIIMKTLMNSVRDKQILIEFYNRGIILPEGITKKDFIDRCRKIILKSPCKTKEIYPNIIYPFNYKKDDIQKKIRINPYYKKLTFPNWE